MSLIVLALVLWTVVLPAVVVLGALYMPRGLPRRFTRARGDGSARSNVISMRAADSARVSRRSA